MRLRPTYVSAERAEGLSPAGRRARGCQSEGQSSRNRYGEREGGGGRDDDGGKVRGRSVGGSVRTHARQHKGKTGGTSQTLKEDLPGTKFQRTHMRRSVPLAVGCQRLAIPIHIWLCISACHCLSPSFLRRSYLHFSIGFRLLRRPCLRCPTRSLSLSFSPGPVPSS